MEYTRKNMVIEDTFLGFEDHGIFTFNLTMKGGGYGVGVGNISLSGPGKGDSIGLLHRILEVVGVTSWEKLKGHGAQVLFDSPDLWGAIPLGLMNLYDENLKVVFKEFFNGE